MVVERVGAWRDRGQSTVFAAIRVTDVDNSVTSERELGAALRQESTKQGGGSLCCSGTS